MKSDFQARAGSGLTTRIAPDDFDFTSHIVHLSTPSATINNAIINYIMLVRAASAFHEPVAR